MITTKELLYSKYKCILLKFGDCSKEINVTERYIYNLHSEKKLPFPVVKYGKLCRVHIEDFANFLDGLRPVIEKRRGRPRKIAPIQYQNNQQLHKGEISDD
ncbi:hypothetical protein [Sulfurirhabdus autotrophica]|uniref:Helix-turn-helix protein n=1 Tax=Sulfurirhabdus autotrophica TaxID=1706046 RepID=A0A4V2W1X4_9PROT|nr:hypothetical protein [Sulfurirhabdus autotrophica]TCV85809.1 hypothetical protein EDC63_10817 [Sulfurirhabdus autotrophica]